MPPAVASIQAALLMLDTFASVGADRFDITHTDIDQERRGFRPGQTLSQVRTSMPYLVESSTRRMNNVIVRPRISRRDGVEATAGGQGVTLVQLDDLDVEKARKAAPGAFLVMETSPGSYQAWMAVVDAPTGFTGRLRRGAGADLNASGATRVAGTLNYKRRYEPEFPMVTIRQAKPGRVVMVDQLAQLGLLAAAHQVDQAAPAIGNSTRSKTSKWPSYQQCLERAPESQSRPGQPKDSAADFTWAMIATSWGHGVDETAARLMQESAKARENGERYARATTERAAWAAQQRNRQLQP